MSENKRKRLENEPTYTVYNCIISIYKKKKKAGGQVKVELLSHCSALERLLQHDPTIYSGACTRTLMSLTFARLKFRDLKNFAKLKSREN